MCSDLAGNSSSDTEPGIAIDKTSPNPPTAAADRTPEDADGGWFKDAVTVAFSSNGDPNGANGTAGSGVDPSSVPDPVTFTTQGSHTATGSVTDFAGNAASASLSVQVDTDAPALSAAFTNADGSTYTPGTWTNQAVTATFHCTDTGGSGVAASSLPQTVMTEGTDQFVVGSCTDNVGHTTLRTFGGIDIDLTPPEASFAFDPGSRDIVVRGTDRGGSGISNEPVMPAVVPGRGIAETRTYALRDGAGNTLVLTLQAKPVAGTVQVSVTSTRYNGAPSIAAPFTNLLYSWTVNRDGSLKSLDQVLVVGNGSAGRRVLASYSGQKNTTTIVDGSATTTRPGLVLVRVATSSGALVIDY
jgi:hypothetical protein